MPSKFEFLSPGIQITEVDESIITPTPDADGPIIIGRTRKGPALKPVKIRRMSDFVSVFGTPIPGGQSESGDVWRDGAGSKAPTYASYAAQSWLASEESPVVMVRLLGAQHSQAATDAAKAGWALATTTTASSVVGKNHTAYGLFIVKSASAATSLTDGALAAIFYAKEGALTLTGTIAGHATATNLTSAANCFIKSTGDDIEFKLGCYTSTGTAKSFHTFNFNRNSQKYIRNALNTDPTLTNTTLYASDDAKTFFLGETFERHLKDVVGGTSWTAGEQYGILMALQSADQTTKNYNQGHQKRGFEAAKSGWVIGQDQGEASSYCLRTAHTKMFRFVALHEGEDIQKDILVAFEDLQLAPNPTVYDYSTFTVRIMDTQGNTLEKYSKCVLDEQSPDYLFRKVGDMYQTWDADSLRYRSYGDYPNASDYVRVEKPTSGLPNDNTLLPFGFLGPGRPKGFTLVSGSSGAAAGIPHIHTYQGAGSAATVFTAAFVMTGNSVPFSAQQSSQVPLGSAVFFNKGTSAGAFSASFLYPAIAMRKSGSDGFSANPYKAYFGINPKIEKDSTVHDSDYADYLRLLPGNHSAYTHTPSGNFEPSLLFSLDQIVINTSTNAVSHESGSRANNTSFTATSGAAELLKKDVRRWVMPVFGGFDGLDIREIEPFRDQTTLGTSVASQHYVVNTLERGIDSVADEEVAPANLMLMPGIRKPKFTTKLIRTCEARQDTLAIVDLENDYFPKAEATQTTGETLPVVSSAVTSLKNRNLNSSYGCAFFPWVQVVDTLNNSEMVWVPASVAALGAMASSQASSEIWFAPAGFNRGGLGNLGGPAGPRVVQARMRLDSGERDELYVQNINPIATFPNEGVVIFGQKTLQSTQSALDRINVRRLMLYLKAQISAVAKNVLFDQNVQATWNRFKSEADPILADVQSRYGLTEYKLILDETTTTPDLIDQNILYAKVFLKPARAIEFIAIDFIISKTGAEFA